MRIGKAQEVISGLSAPEQTRLRHFCRNLSTDKDPKNFDDDMFDILEEVVVPRRREWFKEHSKHLAAVGFNQSKYEYNQIVKQLERFHDKHVPYNGWIDHFKVVKADMIKEVSPWRLKMLKIEGNDDVQALVPRDDAHAGWDYIETGLLHKGDYRENLLQYFSENIEKAKREGSFNCIMIPGSRTQASLPYDEDWNKTYEFESKTRGVIMVGFKQVMAESLWAKPVQTKMGTVDWYAGGKTDRLIYSCIRRQLDKANYWLTVDYSKYDQSIPGWLIYEAFDVIEAMFDKAYYWDEELWKIVKRDFVYKVFLDGDGNLIDAEDGVPSGSMFTQIMDTIVNVLMIRTYFESKGVAKSEYSMIIMGDDNLMCTKFEVDEIDLGGYLQRNFGVKINKDKSSKGNISDPPEFLSRVWTTRGVYRRPEELLAKLLYPEHYRKYDKSNSHNVRQAVYMILSCYIHDFPLGMDWVDKNNIRLYSINEMNNAERIKFTSGLMRYKLQTLYQKRVNTTKYVS